MEDYNYDRLKEIFYRIMEEPDRDDDILGTKKIYVDSDWGFRIEFDMNVYNYPTELDNRIEGIRIMEQFEKYSTSGIDLLIEYEAMARHLIEVYIDKEVSVDEFCSEFSFNTIVRLTGEIINNLN